MLNQNWDKIWNSVQLYLVVAKLVNLYMKASIVTVVKIHIHLTYLMIPVLFAPTQLLLLLPCTHLLASHCQPLGDNLRKFVSDYSTTL